MVIFLAADVTPNCLWLLDLVRPRYLKFPSSRFGTEDILAPRTFESAAGKFQISLARITITVRFVKLCASGG
jgi:hypothetical protein